MRVRQKERQSFMRKQRAAGEIKSVSQWGTGVFEDQLIVAYKQGQDKLTVGLFVLLILILKLHEDYT